MSPEVFPATRPSRTAGRRNVLQWRHLQDPRCRACGQNTIIAKQMRRCESPVNSACLGRVRRDDAVRTLICMACAARGPL